MIIQPIVEGYGEVAAFPVLLRRLVEEAQAWNVSIGRPIRRPRSQLVQKTGVEQAVRLALKEQDCGAILILFDGDDDCPAELGPNLPKNCATSFIDMRNTWQANLVRTWIMINGIVFGKSV